MLVLVGTKHYELSTGNLLFAGSRPALSKFSSRMVVPVWDGHSAVCALAGPPRIRRVCGVGTRLTAHGVLKFETWLEHMLKSVREKNPPQGHRRSVGILTRSG